MGGCIIGGYSVGDHPLGDCFIGSYYEEDNAITDNSVEYLSNRRFSSEHCPGSLLHNRCCDYIADTRVKLVDVHQLTVYASCRD